MRHKIRGIGGSIGLAAATLVPTLLGSAPATITAPTAAATVAAPRVSTKGPLIATPGRPRIVGRPSGTGVSMAAPPTDTACQRIYAGSGIRQCFTPRNVRTAYGVNRLVTAKHEGKGQTIVIVDSFGSPTIASDLRTFDRGYKLVNPPSLRVISPLGRVKFDPNSTAQTGWAAETTLDVEWSHAMAPLASIVVLTSPVNETEGTIGLGDFLKLEQYAFDHKLGQIISQSWAATENTLETSAGRKLVAEFERFYARADRHRFTILGSTGDTGTQNASNPSGSHTYPTPTVNFPSSSPLITAVGGTSLATTRSGHWTAEDVWNDGPGGGAGGGGISRLFAEPSYQRSLPASVQSQLGGHRGLPDVSWNASPKTAILVYSSFLGAGASGYSPIGGTSEGAPQWAGLVADVNQARGNPIGFMNPALYHLASPDGTYLHDIVKGTNAYGGVRGYTATRGWDPASGLGTPRSGQLATALIKAPAGT